MDYIIYYCVINKSAANLWKGLNLCYQSQKCLNKFVLGGDHQRFKPMERSDVSS